MLMCVTGVAAFPVGLFGGGTKPAQHPPGGVGMHEPPVVFAGDAGRGVGHEFLGSGQLFLTGRERLVRHQHGPQVSRGAPPCVGVQRLMGASRCPGGYLGHQSSSGTVAQPVECGPWGVGGGDRLEGQAAFGARLSGVSTSGVPYLRGGP
jgi:hypothetical protein